MKFISTNLKNLNISLTINSFTIIAIFSIGFVLNANELIAQNNYEYSKNYTSSNKSNLSETEKEAETLMFEAVTFMNDGNYRKALEYIDKALVLVPNKFEYQYEQALAFFKLKDYDKAIDILEKLTYDDKVNENVYQVLAASHDFKGKKEDVFRVLKVGLSKFPNSGRLYYEKGVTELGLQKDNEAINSWENGVNLDPNYGNNYYQLINNYKNTDSKLWALIYGEVFLNISQNMTKSVEISKVIYDIYKNSVYKIENNPISIDNLETVTENDIVTIKTSKVKNKKKKGKTSKNSNATYKLRLSDDATSSDFTKFVNGLYNTAINEMLNSKNKNKYLDKEDKLTNIGIIKLREEFIKLWAKSNDPLKKSMFLYDYCAKIEANGNFNTYSNLILSEGNPEDAEKWLRKNTSSINSYIKWQENNPFVIDRNTNYTKIDN
ncbi:MAG: tetratricopeptide repeat protein [Candidatus Kapaibacteriota bacterium]